MIPSHRLCRVLDASSIVGVILIDTQRRIVGWSHGSTAILGWEEAGVVGRCIDSILPPLAAWAATGAVCGETWLRCKDGSEIRARIETQCLTDAADGTVQQIILVPDQTPARAATDTSPVDHGRFWQLSSDLLVIAGLDGAIRALNPAWRQTLGWTEEELLGSRLLDLLHPDDVAARAALSRLQQGQAQRDVTGRCRGRTGGYRRICWSAVPDRGVIYAAGRDVTEQSVALERSQLQLQSLFESNYQYQALVEPDGTLVHANPVSLAAIEADASDVIGRALWDTRWFSATPGIPDKIRTAFEAAAAGSSLRQEITLNLPAGPGILDISLRPVLDPQGTVTAILLEAIDLSQRREAEARLRQAQKMEAIGQLTSGLAHDFNNLLTGIMGSLELLQLRLKSGQHDQLDGYITAALSAGGRAASLTHRLLTFSRRQTLDPKSVQADLLVAGMEDLVRRTVGPAITLETVFAEGLWPIFCDPNQLENALLNLCINARDAMPEGGRLTIRGTNAMMSDQVASERGMLAGDYLAVSVIDTGLGMTADVLARAFDPFFTTKPEGQGTGLGLSMIYGFVRQSGGHVQINSQVGQGTAVTLYMPRYAGLDQQALSLQQAMAPPRAADGQTIVIVDDEPMVRRLVVEALRDLGYATIEAEHGSSALAVLLSSARIDLLITDIGLPGGMDGRKLAEAAQQMRPDLKILFITGYAENALASDRQMQAGMHVLAKPFAIETLASRIKTIIG